MNLLRRQELIPALASQTGFLLVKKEEYRYEVRNRDKRRLTSVTIHAPADAESVDFQSWLDVRFSLVNPPAGLFGRVLLRSFDCMYANWHMDITDSCEASLCVAARIPRVAVTADRFAFVMNEVIEERLAFEQELRDKFNYTFPYASQPGPPPGRGGPGVPMVRGGSNQLYRIA